MVVVKRNNVDCRLKKGNEQQSPMLRVQCFVDPSIHPDLLPTQTLSLYIMSPDFLNFAPVVITATTRGPPHLTVKILFWGVSWKDCCCLTRPLDIAWQRNVARRCNELLTRAIFYRRVSLSHTVRVISEQADMIHIFSYSVWLELSMIMLFMITLSMDQCPLPIKINKSA